MGYKGKFAWETRCDRCDYEFGNIFHICLDKKDPAIKVVHPVKKPKKAYGHSQEGLQNIANAAKQRWEHYREANRERDAAIIDYYKSGRTLKDVRKRFKIGQEQASRILHEAGVMRNPSAARKHYLETVA